ncbi:CoA transferase [Acidobacteria bacterium AH-259-O06]|nr:CoA transferase [Acidobacteria bacterium AH-259-O06]
MLLADQGAEVIRIDPPGGLRFDSPANAVFNRGKKSIVLDLRNEEDVAPKSSRRNTCRDVLPERSPPLHSPSRTSAQIRLASRQRPS